MNPLLLLGSLAVLVPLSFGLSDVCQSEVANLKTCLAAAKGSEQPTDAQKAAWEAKRAAASKCFTDNGCEDPAVKHKQIGECKKQVFEQQIKPKLENCSGLQLPEFEEKPFHHPAFHGRKGRRGGHREEKKEDFFEEVCPSTNASEAVRSCLKALHNETGHNETRHNRHFGRKHSHNGGHHNFKGKLQAVRECFKAINESCKEEMKQAKAAICQCAESQLTNDAEIEASLEACKPAEKEADEAEEEEEKEKDKPTEIQRLIKKFCHAGPGVGKGRRHGKGNWKHGRRNF